MSVILNISQAYSSPPAAPTMAPHASPALSPFEDSVEFSGAAQALADAVGSSSLRLAQIRAIRAEIASGTYETPERIEGTVRRLLDVIA